VVISISSPFTTTFLSTQQNTTNTSAVTPKAEALEKIDTINSSIALSQTIISSVSTNKKFVDRQIEMTRGLMT
jgi:hypothetical protein